MSERAVFLDRDNTIIENDGYLGDPSKVKLLAGAGSALSAIRALGYRLIVVSNQSGVARGMFDEAAVEAVNDEMSRQLKEQAGAYIDASYYCPYHPEAPIPEYRVDHEWRKPKPGMLKQAAADFNLDLSKCWMVGDMGRDIAAGQAAGCRTILLRDTDRHALSGTASEDLAVSPSFVVKTLADAARIIVREGKNPPPAITPPRPAPPTKPAQEAAPLSQKSDPAQHDAASRTPTSSPAIEPIPPARTTPASSRSVDQDALADQVAQRVTQRVVAAEHMGIGAGAVRAKVEKNLEDLVQLLRQQNRHADLRPDFSLSKMAAMVLQVFALAALVIGLVSHFRAPATFLKWEDFFFAQQAHESALLWIGAAAVLQGLVITLLLAGRQK